MEDKVKNDLPGEMGSQSVKLPYASPKLREFGKVHRLTQGAATVGADGALTMTKNQQSDRRTKENVVRIGEHPLGIGLYLFDYLPAFRDQWGHGRQFGVMADEVETVMPEAVSTHANGYKIVDYTLLGISRTRH